MNLLFATTFFFTSFTAFTQLNSVQAIPSLIASVTSETGYSLQLEVEANDVSQIGALSVVVYNQSTGNVVLLAVLTASEIEDQELIQNGKVVLMLGEIEPNGSYLITTDVQNLQLAYFPRITSELGQ